MNFKFGVVGALAISAVSCGVGELEPDEGLGVKAQELGTAQGNTHQGNTHQGNTHQGNTHQGRMLLVWRLWSVPLRNATYTYQRPPVVSMKRQAGALVTASIDETVTVPMSTLSLVGSELRGTAGNGISVAGANFKNVELSYESSPGVTGRLRVVGQRKDTDQNVNMLLPAYSRVNGVSMNSLDLNMYQMQYRQTDGTWANLCESDPSGDPNLQNTALVFRGYWNEDNSFVDDPNALSVSCWDGTAAKCARWGYQPWKALWGHDPSEPNGVYNYKSLKPLHLACARAAMADYCGNGVTHTLTGTPIDIYDRYGFIPKVPESSSLMFSDEGVFSENGVLCLARERYNALSANDCPGRAVVVPPVNPSCYPAGGTTFRAPIATCQSSVYEIASFDRGSLASCNVSGIKYITIANTLETCSHQPYVIGNALAKDCNSCTTAVCNALPGCCGFDSNGQPRSSAWSSVCTSKAMQLCPMISYTPPGGVVMR